MKLGIHTQRPLVWAADLPLAVMKAVNCYTTSKAGIYIYRLHTDDWDISYVDRGHQGGRDYVDACYWSWAYSRADYVEGPNEVNRFNNEEQRPVLIQFWLGAMERAEELGIKLVVFNSSESQPHGGSPFSADYKKYVVQACWPIIQRAIEGSHLVGMHAYWAPWVDGPLDYYHSLGHVEFCLNAWAEMGDITDLKLVINECGIDGGVERVAPKTGWKDYVSIEEYASQIKVFDARCQQIPQIIGYTIFECGAEKDWLRFELDETNYMTIYNAVVEDEGVTNQLLGDYGQQFIVPFNKDAALCKKAMAENSGARAVTAELYKDGYVFQCFRYPDDEVQHWFKCKVGDWANVSTWERQE